ncbi:MAG: 50S ribosomal protein L32 [Gammaproteobacteria bacterium]|nr:MAG: 50S ribosomal protein L32 [Gammaproteobacteria bacterium]
MAVQKSRVTRSRRGMRRAHDGLTKPTLSTDSTTGETHRRHHVSPEGYYKGRQIIDKSVKVEEEDNEE